MNRRSVAALVFVISSGPIAAQTPEGPRRWFEEFEKKFPPVSKNATAEEVERLALQLGLAISAGPDREQPGKEDADAYRQAAIGSWLDEQLKAADDSISSAPPRLQEYLERHRTVLLRVTGLLERDVPQWDFDLQHEAERDHSNLLLIVSLNRILLGAALIEERAGRHVEAGELLEASWSLYRSVAWQPKTISQLIAIAVARHEAGVLRKLSEPLPEWLERMSGDGPRRGMSEAFRADPLLVHARAKDSPEDPFFDVWIRGSRAVADEILEIAPCRLSRMSSEEIWAPANAEVEKSEHGGEEARVLFGIATPNLTNGLMRMTRLMVDRELTAKILELRQEKAASRRNRWPDKLFDSESRVCPGESFEYQKLPAGMRIRFKAQMPEPEAGLVLPLSFETRPPKPTPTPARSPSLRLTPTPTSSS